MCSDPSSPAAACAARQDPARRGGRAIGGRPAGAHSRWAPRAGFTLVELMVVIVIIGLLAGAVTVGVRSYLIAGKQGVARMEIAEVCQALETFYTAYDRYPNNDEGLEILAQANEKFAAPLLNKVPVDPWGNHYQYNQPGPTGPYEVICYGADGREGGQDADADLSSDDLGRSGN